MGPTCNSVLVVMLCIWWLKLTDTLSWLSREAGTIVTLQAVLTVTWIQLTAGLTLLPCTHLTALAPIENERNAFWAGWYRALALTRAATLLTAHLRQHTGRSVM